MRRRPAFVRIGLKPVDRSTARTAAMPWHSTPYEETTMKWETPKACNMRFGFEVTMYIATR